MKVLGLVPARGGSKGIHRKNLVPVGGRPLIAYTADAAAQSLRLARVVLSTDDDEIAAVGESLGLEVPFRRPPELAGDGVLMTDVVSHALDTLASDGEQYDAVFLLQPTNPLRSSADIDGAIALLESSNADSIISFTPVDDAHPARMKQIDADGWVSNPPFAESVEGLPRQQLPRLWLREGSVYLTRVQAFRATGSLQAGRCRAWIIPPERAVNVDRPFDLELVAFLLSRGSLGAGRDAATLERS